MFALTIDQRSSRAQDDRVPGLLALLGDVATVLPFERTAGDEVQGLVSDPEGVIAVIERTMRSQGWSIGLGIGELDTPLPGSVREARGPALLCARDAVEAAKKAPAVHLAVRGGSASAVSEVEAMLRLMGVVLRRRTPGQWRVIAAVAAAGTRAKAAQDLGITVQAISKSLLASADDVVADGYPLLARLLKVADDRSRE